MKKIFLSVFIVVNFNLIQAEPHPARTTSPKDIIIAGALAGCSIEAVNFLVRNERYKHVLRLARRYPGVTVAGLSAVIGTGIIYGQTIKSLIGDRFVQKNS